jgi:hypothetical protein
VLRGRELPHVGADLGDQHLSGAPVHPRDRGKQRHLVRERGDHLPDPCRQQRDRLVQVVNVRQDLRDQQPMMLGAEPALERLPQRRQLGPQPPPGQLGQHRRIIGAADHRLQH